MSYTAYCVGSCSDNVMRGIGQNYNKNKSGFDYSAGTLMVFFFFFSLFASQTCNLLFTQGFISKFTAKLIVEANGNHTKDLISVSSGFQVVKYSRAKSQAHPAFFVVGS